mmetsp:Transcript_23528/g.69067  ORF Transcript_23528/g.69067 Transcript_23528/m.69067 type:complete len:986 (-) Transcript_23528:292-3249(-)
MLDTGRYLPYLGFELNENGMLAANGVWPELSYGMVYPTRFLLLLSVLIPISLRITLELCRVLYAKWIAWDDLMVDAATLVRTIAHTTSLAEDLGQIDYLLTDKTGTLTENQMTFKKCSINNVMYGHSAAAMDVWHDVMLRKKLQELDKVTLDFFRCLSLNHTAQPALGEDSSGRLIYTSPSPDDEALCSAAADIGFHLVERSVSEMRLWLERGNGSGRQHERWQLLNVLEFTNERRRMAVIVRESGAELRKQAGGAGGALRKGRIRMFIKGADDVVLPRLWPGQDVSPTKRHLDFFGDLGLRTLLLGVRDVEEDEYLEWKAKFTTANAAIVERDEKLAAVYDEIERDFQLLGVTAIEDKLQEGVADTIAELKRAHVKCWMLTGDKHATAVQVARGCRLVSPPSANAFIIDVIGNNDDEVGDSINEHLQSIKEGKYAKSGLAEINVVVTGRALASALQSTYGRREAFAQLAMQANTVICCRTEPKQKAQVIGLLKEYGKIVLAIGDGGNDVQMIQAAHVGVGIVGKEGLQAARASDYSTARFRFVRRLLLVHGRYAYKRTAAIALYSFYRSILICTLQLLFNAGEAGCSGASLVHSLFFSLWSILTLPVAFSFALDKDVSETSCDTFPGLYREGQKRKALGVRAFVKWATHGVTQAVIIYYVCLHTFGTRYMHPADGAPVSRLAFGMAVYTCAYVVQALAAFIEHNRVGALNYACMYISCGLYLILWAIASNLPSSEGMDLYLLFGTFGRLGTDPVFAFGVAAISVGAVLPQLAFKFFLFYFKPSAYQVVQFYERKQRLKKQRLRKGKDTERPPSISDSFRHGVSPKSAKKRGDKLHTSLSKRGLLKPDTSSCPLATVAESGRTSELSVDPDTEECASAARVSETIQAIQSGRSSSQERATAGAAGGSGASSIFAAIGALGKSASATKSGIASAETSSAAEASVSTSMSAETPHRLRGFTAIAESAEAPSEPPPESASGAGLGLGS